MRKGLGKDHIPFLVDTNRKIVRVVRLLRDRLGTSDCTGNLPFKKDQTKTKQVQTRIFATLSLN